MKELTELFGPLLPIIVFIAIVGAIAAGFGWLLEHPPILIVVALLIAVVAYVLVKGKFIGSNRV